MSAKTRYCPRGHDKDTLGRTKSNNCRACVYDRPSDVRRAYHLKHLYGITLAQYNEMLAAQNCLCKVCYRHQSELKRAMNVDHDHKTGSIRGLLCDDCNKALGNVRDTPELLRRLAEYLEANNG